MSKKYQSMIILCLLYLVSIGVGILVFLNLESLSLILRLLIADITSTLVIWIFSMIIKNASAYDPYWSVIPPVVLILLFFYLELSSSFPIYLMIAGLTVWSLRLTYNWAKNWTGFHEQDWRYTIMYQKSPKLFFLSNLFGIQLFPTMIVFIQLIGAVYFMRMDPALTIFTWIGFIIMVSAAVIQWIADGQMRQFKERTKGQRLCIEEGLWKYSRHPNYFGEVMVWWGLYLIYFGSVMKLNLLIIAPLLMTSLFLFISIPWMEKKIILTRPEYKEYQKRVSKLIPFFRKEVKHQEIHENA
jgi:steroid 5-alpha reductase family enzyme